MAPTTQRLWPAGSGPLFLPPRRRRLPRRAGRGPAWRRGRATDSERPSEPRSALADEDLLRPRPGLEVDEETRTGRRPAGRPPHRPVRPSRPASRRRTSCRSACGHRSRPPSSGTPRRPRRRELVRDDDEVLRGGREQERCRLGPPSTGEHHPARHRPGRRRASSSEATSPRARPPRPDRRRRCCRRRPATAEDRDGQGGGHRAAERPAADRRSTTLDLDGTRGLRRGGTGNARRAAAAAAPAAGRRPRRSRACAA